VTAPAPAAGAVLTAVARADREWCKDREDTPLDDERREHLVTGIQARLAGPAAPVDPASADELRVLRAAAAKFDERLDDIRTELWKHIEVQERRAKRAEQERDQAHADRDTERHWRDQLTNQLQAKLTEVEKLQASLTETRAEVERLRQNLPELQRAQADQLDQRRHKCAWEWQPNLKPVPLPCSCGRPWPSPTPPDKAMTSRRDKRKGGRT
jgi:hypothetical protein